MSAATLPMIEGSSVAVTRESRISCSGTLVTRRRVVAIDDLPTRRRHLDHADLVAGHGRGVGLAVDDLQRPQAEPEDEEEDEEEDADDAQAEVGARRFVLGRADE